MVKKVTLEDVLYLVPIQNKVIVYVDGEPLHVYYTKHGRWVPFESCRNWEELLGLDVKRIRAIVENMVEVIL